MSFLLPEAGLLFWMLVAFGVVFFILYTPKLVGFVQGF